MLLKRENVRKIRDAKKNIYYSENDLKFLYLGTI